MAKKSENKISLKKLTEISLGDQHFFITLIQQSVISLQEFVIDYERHLASRNSSSTRAVIHKIRPTLMILEAKTMIKYLDQSKNLFGAKTTADQIEENVSAVKKEVKAIVADLKSILKNQ